MTFLRLGRRSSFTLIELLVVMGVIAILAAITLNAAGFVQHKAAASRASAEIAAMEAALERYKVDNGVYPVNAMVPTGSPKNYPGVPTAGAYTAGATVLYTNLSGKVSYSAAATGPIYMEFKPSQINSTNSTPVYVQDPFGYAYGYVCDTPGGTTTNVAFNVGFFDLWSTGGQTGSGTSTNTGQWLTNWKGN